MAVASLDGFWGPRTASVDWCEPNYVKSFYVAEWYNTLSSVVILLAAGSTAYYGIRTGLRKRLWLPMALMAVVGVGSTAFHGTLLFPGQALDELPMIYAACAMFFGTMEVTRAVRFKWLGYALTAYCIGFTYAYFNLPDYFVWFVGSYIFIVAVQIAFACGIWRSVKDTRGRALLLMGAGLYAGGFLLLWLPDKFACQYVQPYHFHAWFHLTSTIGPLCGMQFLAWAFYERDHAEAEARAKGEGSYCGSTGEDGPMTPRRSSRLAALPGSGKPQAHPHPAAAAAAFDAVVVDLGPVYRPELSYTAGGILPLVSLVPVSLSATGKAA